MTTSSEKSSVEAVEKMWEEALADTNPASRRKAFRGDPYESPDEPRPVYPKRKSPMKRARAMIDLLRKEEADRRVEEGLAVVPRLIPNLTSGDVIRLKILKPGYDVTPEAKKNAPESAFEWFTGICIARRNRGLGSSFILRNVVDGVAIERGFPLYTPRICHAERLETKRVRRSKLYYLRERAARESTFGDALRKPDQEKEKR